MNREGDIERDRLMVSVCVITYNHAPYIGECLDSILTQETNFDVEICIGEDDSSDGTREICQEYAKRFPNQIRLFLRDRNDVIEVLGKPTGRRNLAQTMEACRGKYLAMCEGDDFWTDPEKLQIQVDRMEVDPACGACVHNGFVYEGTKNTSRTYWLSPRKDRQTLEEAMEEAHMLTASMLIRREWTFTAPFPDWFMYEMTGVAELLVYKALEHGHLISINRVMAAHRIHPGGVHSPLSREDKLRGGIYGRQIMLKFMCPDSPGVKKKMEVLAKELMNLLYEEGRYDEAKEYYDLLLSRRAQIAYRIPQWSPGLFQGMRSLYMKMKKVGG